MSVLPPRWTIATIGELAEYISRGKSPKYADQSALPIVNQRAVRWTGIENAHLKFVHPTQISAWPRDRYIRKGDILWNSTGTGTVGRACMVTERDLAPPKVVDSHVTIVRPRADLVDPEYLFAWIRAPEVQGKIEALATGTTNQVELSRQTVAEMVIPLAPINEQRRISDKINRLLARLEAARVRLDSVPATLRRFRAAVLEAAVSGRLTKEWRERGYAPIARPGSELALAARAAHAVSGATGKRRSSRSGGELRTDYSEVAAIREIPDSWGSIAAAYVVEPGAEIVYGIVQPGPKLEVGVPYVRGMDIENGAILIHQLMKTSPAIAKRHERASLKGGDVLLGIIRATKVAVVPPELDRANITQGTARLRPSKFIRTKYLAMVLEAPITQNWLHGCYRGIDMPGLNLADVRRTPIPLPSLEEQDEIICRADVLLASAMRVERDLALARERVGYLMPVLLEKAFRGQLVPRNPEDESAKEMLKGTRAGLKTAEFGDSRMLTVIARGRVQGKSSLRKRKGREVKERKRA